MANENITEKTATEEAGFWGEGIKELQEPGNLIPLEPIFDDMVSIKTGRYEELIRKEVMLEAIIRTVANAESYNVRTITAYIIGDLFPKDKDGDKK